MDVILYHLGNSFKERGLSLFSTDIIFSNISNPWLVESAGVKFIDTQG